MPVDASIPLQVKPFEGMNPQQVLSLQHLSQQMQMQNEQLSEFRRKREVENQLRNIYSRPDAIDPTTKMPTERTLADIAKVDPATFVSTRGKMIEATEKQAITEKNVAQMRAALAGVDEKDRKIMNQIQVGAHDAYEAKLKETQDPAQATKTAQEFFSSRLTDEDKLGVLGKKYIEAGRSQPFDAGRSEIMIKAMRPLGVEKETGPSDLKRLMDERDALPEGSPRRKEYDDKIKKLGAPTGAMLTNAPVKGDFTKTGEEFLKSLPADTQNIVKKIAAYEIDPKTLSTIGGHREKMLSLASQYDQTFDQKNYNLQAQAVSRFATGKQGDTVRSLNVAIEHMDTARKLGSALQNGDIQVFNRFAQQLAEQTGKPAPTNFDAVKEIVADEVVKGVIGGPGSVEDRKQAADKIRRASSPAQLNGVFDSWTELLGGQLKGLERQYEGATNRKDFRTKFVTKRAQEAIAGKEQPARRSSDTISAEDQALIDKYK